MMTYMSCQHDESVEEKYLSDFCRAMGVASFRAGGMFWRSQGLRLFTPLPACTHFSLSREDLAAIWKQGAFFIQFPSADSEQFFPGYYYVVDDPNYDFDSIKSSKRRHNIRWALKQCVVERVPFELLSKKSAPLVEDTYIRQGRRFSNSVLERWQNYYQSAAPNPLFESWGAFVSRDLAAFNVALTVRDGINIEMTFCRRDLLKYHPVDALTFVFTQQAITKEGVSYVSYGSRPVTGEPQGLLSFKESMGFKKVPLRESLKVNPAVKPFVCGGLSSLCRAVGERYYARSEYARIVTGVIRTLCGLESCPNTD